MEMTKITALEDNKIVLMISEVQKNMLLDEDLIFFEYSPHQQKSGEWKFFDIDYMLISETILK